MENIKIVKGNPESKEGGKLNSIALDYMAFPLVGSKEQELIEKTFRELWMNESNRFSHQYAYEAQLDEKTVGMITCYPVSVLNRLNLPTFHQLLKLRKWDLLLYSLLHFEDLLAMATLKEGRDNEYHIGSLATLPESRGYGVGSRLIAFAEEQAIKNQYHKCSLTVKKKNRKAIKLYEKLGYKIADSIENAPYSLFRMVKNLELDNPYSY